MIPIIAQKLTYMFENEIKITSLSNICSDITKTYQLIRKL